MIRNVGYRMAAHAFAFTGLWFVIGAFLLWTPIPGALGIGSAMFAAWLLLFFTTLAVSGATLTLAAVNGFFPPDAPTPAARRKPQRPPVARQSGDPMWAPSPDATIIPTRPRTVRRTAARRAADRTEG